MFRMLIMKWRKLLLELDIEGYKSSLAHLEKLRINDRVAKSAIEQQLSEARRKLLLMIMEGGQ